MISNNIDIKICKKLGTPVNNSLAILCSKRSSFNLDLLGAKEKSYILSCLKKKIKSISINQYDRWVFFEIVERESISQNDIYEQIRKTAFKLHRKIKNEKIEALTIAHLDDDKEELWSFAEGLMLSNYQFLKYKKLLDENNHTIKEFSIYYPGIKINELQNFNSLIQAVYYTKNLVNEPLSYLTAVKLSEEIKKMGRIAGFEVEILQKKEIEKLNMGGLLTVNKGSLDPPTFSILKWNPVNPKNKKPVVLVGKGVVYDTGGISIKPTSDSMDYMKSDMSGAAVVVGTFLALAKTKTPVKAIGLIPATDNRPDGNAYVPGDIVKMFDGTTVEVLNTDAEGRMILADALSYAKKYNPELVIDIATLTGSAQRAIGNQGIVGMGNAQRKYIKKLKESGNKVHERIAEFPFWDEYREQLKSDIADLKNIGEKYAGAITAGKFLEHFTDYPYFHLDIAGPAYNKKLYNYRGKGASGVGVRLLFDFLANLF